MTDITKRIQVSEVTKVALAGLVMTALALFGQIDTAQAARSEDASEEMRLTTSDKSSARQNEGQSTPHDKFIVEFHDTSGKKVAVRIDTHTGTIIDIDQTYL